MAYLSNIDTNFTDLVANGNLSSSNVLQRCLPSTLNLTKDCLATYDFYNATTLPDNEVGSILTQIGVGVWGSVPLHFQNASRLDFTNYGFLLMDMVNMYNATRDSVIECIGKNDSTSRLTIPLSAVNFSQDCTISAPYWTKYRSLDTTFLLRDETPWQADSSLIRASINSSYHMYSDFTLAFAARPLFERRDTVESLRTAVLNCPDDVCKKLGFTGNSDIAGTGAVATYFVIAVLSTLFGLYSKLHRWKKFKSSPIERAWLETAYGFFDTVLFFSIMVSIAGVIYIVSRAQSLYEVLLCSFATFLALNANFVLLAIQDCETEADKGEELFRVVPFIGVWIFSVGASVNTLFKLNRTNFFMAVDAPCFTHRHWPVALAKLCAVLTLVQYSTIMVGLLYLFGGRFLLGKALPANIALHLPQVSPHPLVHRNLLGPLYKYIQWSAFVFLWVNMGAFWSIRGLAPSWYGPSFEDNGMGYGQILATGFCLQAVTLLIWKLLNTPKHATRDALSSLLPTSPRPSSPRPVQHGEDEQNDTALKVNRGREVGSVPLEAGRSLHRHRSSSTAGLLPQGDLHNGHSVQDRGQSLDITSNFDQNTSRRTSVLSAVSTFDFGNPSEGAVKRY